MLSKLTLHLLPILLLFSSLLPADRTRANAEPGYVKLEVKGKLVEQGSRYAVEAADTHFADTKVLVVLGRSEDKNRRLDRHLESLKGKTVVANGFLDCRRIGQEQGVIYLYLSSQSQINAGEDD